MDRRVLLVMLALCVVFLLLQNPIRFNQTAHAGGLSMKVPVLWTPMNVGGKGMPIALRREWAPFVPAGSVNVMDWTAMGSNEGPWTATRARALQADAMSGMSKDSHFSDVKALDLKVGSRTAVCEESTLNRHYRSLICYIVGTPLQFSFGGSPSTEPAAEKMLASLE